MRPGRAARPTLRHAIASSAAVLCALVLGGCAGGGDSPDQPSFGAGGVSLTPAPAASASPTPLTYTGRRVDLGNTDNGTHIATSLGSDLFVRVTVPLTDDCQGTHPCVVWRVDDSAGVLLREQELTTCDKDTCVAQREHFLARTGSATLSLVAVQPCSPFSGSRCEPQAVSTLWSAHVTVGTSG